VPRVPDDWLEIVAFLYQSEEEAKPGEAPGGSGFVVAVPFSDDARAVHYYVVTAGHVIGSGATVARLNALNLEVDPSDPSLSVIKGFRCDVLPLGPHQWTMSPEHDFAVSLIGSSRTLPGVRAIPIDELVTRQYLAKWWVGAGDEVFMLGRFLHAGQKRWNQPTARFGAISMMPAPVYNKFTQRKQISFLVETHSQSGYSGSAVVLYLSPLSPQLGVSRDWTEGPQLRILGLDWGHLNTRVEVVDENGRSISKPPHMFVERTSGLAAVIPAWFIRTMLEENKDLLEQRKQRENMAREGQARFKGSPVSFDLEPPLVPLNPAGLDLTREGFMYDLRKIKTQPIEKASED
jgi:hypothetical protein